MKLSSKATWALAWTGLAVVLGVPSADYLAGVFDGGPKTVMTSDVQPVKTAAIDPAAPAKTNSVTTIKTDKGVTIVPAGSTPLASGDVVDKYLSSGKALPDYITDSAAPAPANPAVAVKPSAIPVATETDVQVAAIKPEPVIVPRLPLPASARPPTAIAPKAVIAAPGPAVVTAPVVTAPVAAEPTVIVDESTLTGSIAVPAGPVPPAPIVDDSANWEEESLRQYLERRGILEGDGRSSARVTQRSGDQYDPDGFYLSDGPNSDRVNRSTRRDRIIRMLEEDVEEDGFTLF